MSMVIQYLLLIVGFFLLVKGADVFVVGSSSIAKILRIPPLIIGLTVVAFGTSAPEAAVSISASVAGSNEIAISNILGSNIFNLLGVVGVCALIKPLTVQKSIIKKEFPFTLVTCFVMIFMFLDIMLNQGSANILSRGDGFILLTFFAIFMFSLILFAMDNKTTAEESNSTTDYKKLSTFHSVFYTVIGLIMVVVGGNFVVTSASEIAASFGVSQTLIGLTIVAIGTSLPELVTSIVATRKGECDIALGNVVGSNIFNVFFILGFSSVISPLSITAFSISDLLILTAITLVCYLFAISKRSINRLEGGVMVTMYLAYTAYIIMR